MTVTIQTKAFLANKPAISGCGGLIELYTVFRGEIYTEIKSQHSILLSVTYNSVMIQNTIEYFECKKIL